MEGLIEEGSEVKEEGYDGSLLDAALIGTAQRIEHYEIAGYDTARSFAELLGETDHACLLNETLEEENETDEKLADLAKQINAAANESAEQPKQDRKKPKRVA